MKTYPFYPAQKTPIGAKLKYCNAIVKSVFLNLDGSVSIETESGKTLHYCFDQTVYCIPEP